MSQAPEYLQSWLTRRREASERTHSDAVAARARLSEVVRCLVNDFGSTRVVLFGSLTRCDVSEGFDVDFEVLGLGPERYFHALARVSDILGRNVDLVEIEVARPSLTRHIEETGEILYDAAA